MDGQRPLPPPPPPEGQDSLADDILEGADVIAAFMWGSASKRRKVYHLMETSRLPLFKIGNVWCARKSRLKEYIREQEDRNAGLQSARKPVRQPKEYTAEDIEKGLLKATMLAAEELLDEHPVYDDMLEDEDMWEEEDQSGDEETPDDEQAKADKD